MEITPRSLDAPVLEDYPVSHEVLMKKMDQVELLTAHYEDDSGEQDISTTFIPGNGLSKETIIVNVPWSDSAHREFNIMRHAALAEHTGSDVVLIGFPGYDEADPSSLTPLQEVELTRDVNPSFQKTGKALASAVEQLSTIDKMGPNYWQGRDVTVAGYSQGSSSQIGMLSHLPSEIGTQVKDLFIWESPDALQSQSKFGLKKKFMIDGNKAGKYFKENEQVFGKDQAKELGVHDKGFIGVGGFVTMLARKRSKLLTGALDAMATSTLESDAIERAYKKGLLDDVRIHVINGDDSVVSPMEQNNRLMSLLIDKAPNAGDKIHVVRKGDSHGHQESFARYTSTVEEIKK